MTIVATSLLHQTACFMLHVCALRSWCFKFFQSHVDSTWQMLNESAIVLDMTKIPTIGFISALAWRDPAPSEFSNVIVEEVRAQQAPLLLPEFDY